MRTETVKAPSSKAKTKGPSGQIEFVSGPWSPFSDEDAEILGPLLEKLASKYGKLDKKTLLEEAENNPNSPLRKYFQWDDAKAAYKFRLIQAQRILQFIRYRVETPEGILESKVFEAVTLKNELPNVAPGRGYVRTSVVVQHDSLSNQILERALKELRQWKERYESHKKKSTEFREVFEAIERFESKMFKAPKSS